METQLAPLPISASGIRHKDPRAVVTLRAGLLKCRLSVFLGHQKKRRHYIFLEKLTKYYFSTTEEIIWGHTGVLLLYHLRLGLVLTSSYFVFWNCWELNQDFAYARQVLLYWHTATMYHLLFYYYYCSKRESWSPPGDHWTHSVDQEVLRLVIFLPQLSQKLGFHAGRHH